MNIINILDNKVKQRNKLFKSEKTVWECLLNKVDRFSNNKKQSWYYVGMIKNWTENTERPTQFCEKKDEKINKWLKSGNEIAKSIHWINWESFTKRKRTKEPTMQSMAGG